MNFVSIYSLKFLTCAVNYKAIKNTVGIKIIILSARGQEKEKEEGLKERGPLYHKTV